MDRKHKTGEVIAYLLTTVTGTLLLPVVVPVIMSMNTRGYADGHSLMPDVQSRDGFANVLTAFAYVAVFTAPNLGMVIFASGGGTVGDSSPAGVDGGELVAGLTAEPTSTLSEVPTLPPVEEENKDADRNNETQDHE